MLAAVIPSRDRPADLQRCLESLTGQVDVAIIVDNGSSPPIDPADISKILPVIVIRDPQQPPNLSQLWNVGIAAVAALAGNECWHVAIVNDDAVVPPVWMGSLVSAMEIRGATAGCYDPHSPVGMPRLYREPLISVMDRMVGWAFVLHGCDGLMADEDLRWWYGDTAIDVQARKMGGTLIMPGDQVHNYRANASTTGILAEQAGRDRATFEAKYGPVPW